jgi:hypothetical protein
MPDKTPLTDDELRADMENGWAPHAARLAAELLAARARIAELEAAQTPREPDAYIAVNRHRSPLESSPGWDYGAYVIPAGDLDDWQKEHDGCGWELLPIVADGDGTRAVTAQATPLEFKPGGVYRNATGGVLHAVQRMVYLTHGSFRMPAAVFGDVWLMESRSNEWGTVPYLCTAEGLRENGYRTDELREVRDDA